MLPVASTDFGASGTIALFVLIFLVIGLSLFVAAIRHISAWLPGAAPQQRRLGVCLGICLTASIIMPCCASWYFYYKPRWDFEKLLDGAENIQITSLKIAGNDGWLILNEPSAANYITEAFRSSKTDNYGSGYVYNIEASLSTGGSVACWIYIPTQPFKPFPLESIHLGYPTSLLLHDAVLRRTIRLREPIPDQLAEIIEKIRVHHPERPSMIFGCRSAAESTTTSAAKLPATWDRPVRR